MSNFEERLEKECDKWQDEAIDLRARLKQVEAERDEWMKEAEAGRTFKAMWESAEEETINLERERDALREKLREVERIVESQIIAVLPHADIDGMRRHGVGTLSIILRVIRGDGEAAQIDAFSATLCTCGHQRRHHLLAEKDCALTKCTCEKFEEVPAK